jgi:hypothetical protein
MELLAAAWEQTWSCLNIIFNSLQNKTMHEIGEKGVTVDKFLGYAKYTRSA